MYLLGLDIGTTNWKAIAYTPEGGPVAQVFEPARTDYLPEGRATHDPTALWDFVVSAIRRITDQIGPGVAGIAVTSFGEAGLLVDRDGEPLTEIIAWFDARTAAAVRWWDAHFGADRLYQITGTPPQYIMSLNKIMWLRDNLPEVFSRAWKWMCVADYVAFKLCGVCGMDYSLASRTMAFDIRRKAWSEEILQAADVPSSLLPDPVPSGLALGRATPEVSRLTGLDAGTIVGSGGHDHLCGGFAAGCIRPGDVLDSLGTAEAIVMALAAPSKAELAARGLAQGCHVLPDTYYILAPIPMGGGSWEWCVDLFKSYQQEDKKHEESMAAAGKVPPGSGGLVYLPHLRGMVTPRVDAAARGAFLGMRSDHAAPHFLRACLEGLSFTFRACIDAVEEAAGKKLRTLRGIGGGTRNDLWLQIKADVTDTVIEVPDITEATTQGAAMLGGLAAGIYRDVTEAVNRAYRLRAAFRPRAEYRSLYDSLYTRVYLQAMQACLGIDHQIADIFDGTPLREEEAE